VLAVLRRGELVHAAVLAEHPGLVFGQISLDAIAATAFAFHEAPHPYDIESSRFEKTIKENGLHFIKIETNDAKEDRQSLLTRFEAFRETLC